jgi:hypothetical protein
MTSITYNHPMLLQHLHPAVLNILLFDVVSWSTTCSSWQLKICIQLESNFNKRERYKPA